MLHYMQIICFENTQYYLTQHSCSTPFEDLPIWKIQWKNLHVILLIFRSGETIFTLGRSLIHEFWKNYQILHFSLSKIWKYWGGHDLPDLPRSAAPENTWLLYLSKYLLSRYYYLDWKRDWKQESLNMDEGVREVLSALLTKTVCFPSDCPNLFKWLEMFSFLWERESE